MTLHVTNGESAASSLRERPLEGDVLSWDDVLHVGPLAFEPAESRPIRARFLAGNGGDAEAIEAKLEQRDDLLARAVAVALWFEHDLYDQLQLLQILSQVSTRTNVVLVQADVYLGSLEPADLEALWPSRRRVEPETVELACEAWRAVVADEVEPLLERDTSALPHLDAALHRLLEERQPLSRTKRQLLAAITDGPRTPIQLFLANQTQEEAIFLGDAWCFTFLDELERDGLVAPAGESELELTPAGRALVA
ncbi:MAG: DUF1835 domain-containing protein [Actinobacteria bacterium]|nr:DUF1835 domain-containing protein [Actinomycetota bacterium]